MPDLYHPSREHADSALTSLLVVGVLVALTAALLPAAGASGMVSFPVQVAGDEGGPTTAWADVPAMVLHPAVLAAMALAWVLARGSADLSVWVVYAAGGAVAARVLQAGGPLPLAGLAAAGMGLGVGGFHAAIVNWTKIPGWAVSAFTAFLGAAVLAWSHLVPTGYTLDGPVYHPVMLVGWLVLAGLFVMQGIPEAWPANRPRPGPRAALALTMLAGSVVAALGGMAWVVRSGSAVEACGPVGDLRVLAAAVLAGGLVVRGPMRALMVGVLVGPAMLLATVWKVMVWDMPAVHWPVNLLVLTALVAGVHLAGRLAIRTRRPRLGRWVALMLAGLVLVAASAITGFLDLQSVSDGADRHLVIVADMTKHPVLTAALRLAGVGAWLVGLTGFVARYRTGAAVALRPGEIVHE